MTVVFDEVIGNIEPEVRSVTEEEKKAPAVEKGELKVRQLLCKLEQREARLRAD